MSQYSSYVPLCLIIAGVLVQAVVYRGKNTLMIPAAACRPIQRYPWKRHREDRMCGDVNRLAADVVVTYERTSYVWPHAYTNLYEISVATRSVFHSNRYSGAYACFGRRAGGEENVR